MGRSAEPPIIRYPAASDTSVTPRRANVLTCDRNARVDKRKNASSESERTRGTSDALRTVSERNRFAKRVRQIRITKKAVSERDDVEQHDGGNAAVRSFHAFTITGYNNAPATACALHTITRSNVT